MDSASLQGNRKVKSTKEWDSYEMFILKALYRLLLVRLLLFPEDEELSYEFVRPLVAPMYLPVRAL